MRTLLRRAALVLLVAFVAVQFIPVERTNPPVEPGSLVVPREVEPLLRRACYDCHSHETRWPWYAYVAPVSWLVADDVKDARRHLIF